MSGRWFDSLGREVDIEDIDKKYALNILTMVLLRRGRAGCGADEVRQDPLVQRLRKAVLENREPGQADAARARQYNKLNEEAGLPFRASVDEEYCCDECNPPVKDIEHDEGYGLYWYIDRMFGR